MVEYEYALDESRNAVYIEDATPGQFYSCPDCESEMFPKNRGLIKDHHYAHKNIESHNGSVGESPLHSNTKYFIANIIKNALANNQHVKTLVNCPKISDYSIHYTKIPYGLKPGGWVNGVLYHYPLYYRIITYFRTIN